MSLTGFPLILFAAFCTLAAVAATALLWNRFGRTRIVLRAGGVLLAEGLLLFTVALVANRSEQFYPTWDTLLDTGKTEAVSQSSNAATFRSTPGELDHQLAVRAGGRPDAALTLPWQSADWRGWGLATVPTVLTPPGYLRHPTWSYSAVVVIGAGPDGWTAADEESAARRAIATGLSAVVVFTTPTAATTPQALATALPDQLSRDLRVTPRRWAVVTATADADLAQSVVGAAAARYPSIAVVPSGVHAGGAGGHGGRTGPARQTTTGLVLPVGVTVAYVVVGNPATGQPAGAVPLPSTAADALYTGLSWAIARTPPPLAPPPVAGVPPVHAKTGKPGSVAPAGHPSPSLPPNSPPSSVPGR